MGPRRDAARFARGTGLGRVGLDGSTGAEPRAQGLPVLALESLGRRLGRPGEERWLANGTTHRAFDPVSGQADFKKCACRIERLG